MPRTGIRCVITDEAVADTECLRCKAAGCDRVERPCEPTYEMLAGMMDGGGRQSAHISSTMLTANCPRRVALEQTTDYQIRPLRVFAAWRGTMGHHMTERHPQPGCIYERRFETTIEVDGVCQKVTGQIDKLDIDRAHIEDFKTKADGKLQKMKSPEAAHIMQLNIYRWLALVGWPQSPFTHAGKRYAIGQAAEIEVNSLKLVYWSMNAPKPMVAPLLDLEEVEAYVVSRVRSLQTGLPPIPFDLDPFTSVLCREWCAVREACVEASLGF